MKRAFDQIHRRFRGTLLLLFLTHCLASCTTAHTARMVNAMPMDFDLEKRVMWETKLSGAATGAVGGAVIGLLVGVTVSAATGGMLNHTQQGGLIGGTAAAGAVAGGIFGYQKGKEKGEKIVASAKEKDLYKRLVQGAKEYNSKIASYNSGLRKQLADAKKTKDKKKLTALKKEANNKLANVSSRLQDRSNLLEKIQPDSRSPYARTVPELKTEQAKLKTTVRDIGLAETPFSL